jgi:FkbM family methyltransferase
MGILKRYFKRKSHSTIFKYLAGFGRALNRFYENRNHDIYSNGELVVLKKLAKSNPKIIFDGGANIGKYSKKLIKYMPHSSIYAFEPVKTTYDILTENLKEQGRIITINKGFYRENCSKEINLFDSNTQSSLYEKDGFKYSPNAKTNIELIKGDDFLIENNITNLDFLKIDIEGAEYDALMGFEKYIARGAIKIIQFEYGYLNISSKKLLIDFYQFFEKHNYKVGKIFPEIVEFREYELKYEDFLGPNYLAVLNSEIELIKRLSTK